MDQYLRQGLETLKSGESQLRSGVETANNAMDSDARERQAEQVAYAQRRREQREEEANPTSGVSKFLGGLMGGNEEEERRKREEEERRRREEEGSIGGMIGGLLGTKKQEPKEYSMGDHIHGVFGGGRKAEDQEDMIDKGKCNMSGGRLRGRVGALVLHDGKRRMTSGGCMCLLPRCRWDARHRFPFASSPQFACFPLCVLPTYPSLDSFPSPDAD
jgi:hypothetical protein